MFHKQEFLYNGKVHLVEFIIYKNESYNDYDDDDDDGEVTVYVYATILYDGLFDGICRCAAEDLVRLYGGKEDLYETYRDDWDEYKYNNLQFIIESDDFLECLKFLSAKNEKYKKTIELFQPWIESVFIKLKEEANEEERC